MKYFFLSLILLISYTTKAQWIWARGMGGSGMDYGNSVSVDSFGNAFICGEFSDVFQAGAFILAGHPNGNGPMDIFILKIDSTGNVLWAKEAGGTGMDDATDNVIDQNGNCIIVGYFSNTADFGQIQVTSNGIYDAFVSKYNTSGTALWVKSFGATSLDIGYRVCVDNSGNIYTTGVFRDSLIIDSLRIYSPGIENMFVAKFTPAGSPLWSKKIIAHSSHLSYIKGISSDLNNNIYLSGDFNGWLVSDNDSIYNSPYDDFFIIKLDSNGTTSWINDVSDAPVSSMNYSNDFTVDESGNLFITGMFQDSLVFGNTTVHSGFNPDMFLCKFTANGSKEWIRKGGGGGLDAGMTVTTDNNGHEYCSAEFFGTATFGNIIVTSPFTQYTSTCILKYDSAGNELAGNLINQTADEFSILNLEFMNNSLYHSGDYSGSPTLGNFQYPLSNYYNVSAGRMQAITTSLNENTNVKSSLILYPNPVTSVLYIKNICNVSIIDESGRVLVEKHFDSFKKTPVEIDVTALTAGFYFIKADELMSRFIKL
ncbi:MAG: T9SS type A sorting domain-containing protein [Bacteroidota bacterium]